jgi:hypothetical protein
MVADLVDSPDYPTFARRRACGAADARGAARSAAAMAIRLYVVPFSRCFLLLWRNWIPVLSVAQRECDSRVATRESRELAPCFASF